MDTFCRFATNEDVRNINNLINVVGGQALMKAMFGPFNISSIIESSLVSLLHKKDTQDDTCSGFMNINDSVTLSNDIEFDDAIQSLSKCLFKPDIKVSLFLISIKRIEFLRYCRFQTLYSSTFSS